MLQDVDRALSENLRTEGRYCRTIFISEEGGDIHIVSYTVIGLVRALEAIIDAHGPIMLKSITEQSPAEYTAIIEDQSPHDGGG